MALSETQIFGYAKNMLELLDKEATALKKARVDVDKLRTDLQKLYDKAAGMNAHQEDLKRQTVRSTIDMEALRIELYVFTSGVHDGVLHAVKKNSPEARNIRRLRSRITRTRNGVETPVEVVPETPAKPEAPAEEETQTEAEESEASPQPGPETPPA